MPQSLIEVLAHEAQLLARNDAASSSSSGSSKDTGGGTTDQPSPPALSPTAIVGLAIIGAVFVTILLAAMLRLCMSPTPQESNPSSLYRPDDSNVSQLARLKEVREIGRRAAWEKACTVEAQEEKEIEAAMEREKRRKSGMSVYYGMPNSAASSSKLGSGSGSGSDEAGRRQQLRGPGVGGDAGVRQHHRARMSPGTERAQRDREWRARMGVSAMEARGEVEVEENWDLAVAAAERERRVLRGASAYGYDSVVYDDRESGVDVAGVGHSGVADKGKEPGRTGRGDIEPDGEGGHVGEDDTKRYTYPMVALMRREV